MNKTPNVLFTVQYGSKLYGTSTPTSDTDLKTVFLPELDDMLLGKKLQVFKTRLDAQGAPVPDKSSMPDNGVENEYIPFQTFVRDFVNGQTYAVEVAFAILKDEPSGFDGYGSARTQRLVKHLIGQFGNCEVYSMCAFAQKQTFDYVKRGERLKEAQKVLDILEHLRLQLSSLALLAPRLDTLFNGEYLLDTISQLTGLPLGTTVNNNRTLRTLELNGRSYTESTELKELHRMVQKFVEQYGDRSEAASKLAVDFKSLSHAVRVYQQAIEILDTGVVTFPRPNAAELLQIKRGEANLEEVKALLQSLDNEVQVKLETTVQRKKTPELQADAEQWLSEVLRELYNLE